MFYARETICSPRHLDEETLYSRVIFAMGKQSLTLHSTIQAASQHHTYRNICSSITFPSMQTQYVNNKKIIVNNSAKNECTWTDLFLKSVSWIDFH
jgi:hypothetical protein